MCRLRNKWLLPVAAIVCGCGWVSCTSSSPKNYNSPTSGEMKISVDESFAPIIQQEIDVFEYTYPDAAIFPEYVSEVEAITMLLRDSVRLAVTTRELTAQEEASLKSKKLNPQTVKIAIDGIALIINKQNPDSLIRVSDIRDILTGKVTEWNQLYPGSKLGKIQLVFDNANSSTVRFAMDSICKGEPLSPDLRAQKSNSSVIDHVAQDKSAIGVIGASWIGNPNDTTNLSFSDEITVMSVSAADVATLSNSYKPYQAYLALGKYPLIRNVYIILTDAAPRLPVGFTRFVWSDKGQRIILRSGLVPATQAVRIVNVRDEL
ncbi:MAG: substrate-binding domain-containing protein [Coprobacter sp.]|nr:substrate-binding domain-containing protein [Coprobacter sp.]